MPYAKADVKRAISDKGIQATTVLFDSWDASLDNLKLIQRTGRYFITTLKNNRKVSVSKEAGYLHLEDLPWGADAYRHGFLKKFDFQ